MKIIHNTREKKFRNPFGSAQISSKIRLSVESFCEDNEEVLNVALRLWKDGTGEKLVPMSRVLVEANGGQIYESRIKVPNAECDIWYYFIFKVKFGDCVKTIYYGNNCNNTGGSGSIYDGPPPSFRINVYKTKVYPSWLRDGIVYQIFPDRFARDEEWKDRCSVALNSKKSAVIEEDWYRAPEYERGSGGNVSKWQFYGGSLKGIREKLAYLKMMGVGSILMNPIFTAESNHRYDTSDYMSVDPILGTNEDFEELTRAASELDINIILEVTDSDVSIDGFNRTVDEYDGVIARWQKRGAKGCYIANNPALKHRLTESIKNKIVYDEEECMLLEKRIDLRESVVRFLRGEISAQELNDIQLSIKENVSPDDYYGMLSFIGDHNCDRILSVMGADYNYHEAAEKVKMLAALQYMLPGVPCIYYGDEAGMTGGGDPKNRAGFIWGNENEDIQGFYRQLGVLYDEHEVLKNGSVRFLDAGSNVFAFIRENAEEKIVILANRSYEEQTVPGDAFEGLNVGYALNLLSSEILVAKDGKFENGVKVRGCSAMAIYIADEEPVGYEMERSAGVLCHLSSIPGGKLGKPARDFVDYIASAGMKIWQMLPLNPAGLGDSPYSSNAAFAGETAFVNYDELPDMKGFNKFCKDNSFWLEDYAAYCIFRERFDDVSWTEWPEKYKNAAPGVCASAANSEAALEIKKEQYYFAAQWDELRKYANSKGVSLMGDLPVFVSADSVDVWANKKFFLMDAQGNQSCHAGVPPDYFSPDGQDWGNPLYDWNALEKDGYGWWIRRLRQCAWRYDYLRLDHFRSFSEFFAVPQGKSPRFGNWRHGAGRRFFKAVAEALGEQDSIKILAEDLGALDNGVYNLLKFTGLPGMNIWQFSADEMTSMSEDIAKKRVFYTGTHDNQTLAAWVEDGLSVAAEDLSEVGTEGKLEMHEEALEETDDIIRTLYESDSPWIILQLQDMFMLGDEARMNVPGTASGNWHWKIEEDSIYDAFKDAQEIAEKFAKLAKENDRL